MIERVPDDPSKPSSGPEAATHAEPRDRGAAQDLAEGLDLMLRAAKKAVKNLDPARLEELGRRAVKSVEQIDKRQVEEMGRMAKKHLDPRKVEEVAEEAGRELLAVVERVADRIDSLMGGARTRPESAGAEARRAGEGDAPRSSETARPSNAESEGGGISDAGARPRVRVDPDE